MWPFYPNKRPPGSRLFRRLKAHHGKKKPIELHHLAGLVLDVIGSDEFQELAVEVSVAILEAFLLTQGGEEVQAFLRANPRWATDSVEHFRL